MGRYVIGIDYGTLSARAVMVSVDDGKEIATSEFVYPHGIMTEREISGKEAKATTALQHPKDYLDALSFTVKEVLRLSGKSNDEVVGLCLDCTASTVIPYLSDGTPLCFVDGYENNPDAYIKLWKHHGAAEEAERMTRVAEKRGEEWLSDYGSTVSGEWLFPKIAEVARYSPEVYERAEVFGEAAEWLVERITGERSRSACMAGYKALWSAERGGYPSDEYFEEVSPAIKGVLSKVSKRVLPLGEVAGCINEHGEKLSGLKCGTVVAVPVIDAHAALPAAKVTHGGDLMVILGTSACHIVLSRENVFVKGICGKVDGGVIPGFYAYEAGQPCVGDMLGWFVNNCLPERYVREAERLGVSRFDYLDSLAKELEVGKSGLLALDWWNGNRSPYVDYELSGLIVGLTLSTKPEEIYYALICSIAFGTRRLIELFKNSGVSVDRVTAAGGISVKNPFFMQTLSDVIGMEICVTDSKQAGAKGSAIYAAAAAGCYPTVAEAAEAMGDGCSAVYYPRVEKHKRYEELYSMFVELSEHFSKSDIMKRLRKLQ